MELVTVPKTEYRKLVKTQEEMQKRLGQLATRVDQLSDDVISPATQKKLDRLSRSMDKGAGRRFPSVGAFKKYVASLS